MSVVVLTPEELGALAGFVAARVVSEGLSPTAVDLACEEVSRANATAYDIRYGSRRGAMAAGYSAQDIARARRHAPSRRALTPLEALRLALKLCYNVYPGQVHASQAMCLYDLVGVVVASLPQDAEFASLRRLDARRSALGGRALDACTLGLFLRAFCRRAGTVVS